jgi:hypothetical protein
VVEFTNWRIATKIFKHVLEDLLDAYQVVEKIGRKYFKALKIVPDSEIASVMKEIFTKNARE